MTDQPTTAACDHGEIQVLGRGRIFCPKCKQYGGIEARATADARLHRRQPHGRPATSAALRSARIRALFDEARAEAAAAWEEAAERYAKAAVDTAADNERLRAALTDVRIHIPADHHTSPKVLRAALDYIAGDVERGLATPAAPSRDAVAPWREAFDRFGWHVHEIVDASFKPTWFCPAWDKSGPCDPDRCGYDKARALLEGAP